MSISNALVWGNAHNIMPIGIKRLFNIIASQLNLYLPELDNKETIVCLWIVWAHSDLKFGCYDCIGLEIAKNYDIFVDESEIKGTIEALIDKKIVHRSVTKEKSHNISLTLVDNLQDNIVDECSKELAFIAEQARKIGKLTCPRCGSMDINISKDEPKEFMFCHECSIMRIPESVVEDKNENKNKKKREIDEEFLNDLTLACIQELMSSHTEELEKDVYMSNDYATFRFSESRISWVTNRGDDGLPDFGPHEKIWVIHYGFHDFETKDNLDRGVKVLLMRQLSDILEKRKLHPGIYISTLKLLGFINQYKVQLGLNYQYDINELFPVNIREFKDQRIQYLLLWIM